LAPLAGSLNTRDSRAALAAAFAALAKLVPDLQESSALLIDLNAMSTIEVSWKPSTSARGEFDLHYGVLEELIWQGRA